MGRSLVVLLFVGNVAAASPNVSVQGVLTNAAGLTVEGTYNVAVGLFDAPVGGNVVWPQSGALFNSNIQTTNGVFSLSLANVESAALAQKELWLGIQVMGEPELKRVPVQASIRALIADTANNLQCTGCVKHAALAQGQCANGQVLKWQDTGWACANDNNNAVLTEANVDQMVANNGYAKQTDLKALADGLSPLASSGSWTELKNIPPDIANGDQDTQLKEADVDQMVGNNGYLVSQDLAPYAKTAELAPFAKSKDLAKVATTGQFIDLKNVPAGLKDGDNDLLASLKCKDTQIAQQVNGQWTCQPAKASVPSGAQPPACTPASLADLFYRTSDKKLMMCDGSKFRVVKLCEGKCPEQSTAICGEPITDDCNEPCNTKGNALNSTQCATAAQQVLCGQTVQDECANTCANKGVKLNVGACYAAGAVACGKPITDPCGNVCTGKGTNCAVGTLCSDQGCQAYGSNPQTALATCKALLNAGIAKSGAYYIDPDLEGAKPAFQVYCDMTTQGGGWTLIAKVKGDDATLNRKNTAQWRDKTPIGNIAALTDENALGASYDSVPFRDVMIRSLSTPSKNLGWSHGATYPSVWSIIDAGKRVSDGTKMFGSVMNLDSNGNKSFHNDCSILKFGFLTADWSQNSNNGIVGHTALNHGHSGGVVGASLFDPSAKLSHNYNGDIGITTNCVSDFSLGGGYDNLQATKDSYAINAHYWGQGNTYTHSWKSHILFVR